MTSPQSDPASDVPAALARLAEQLVGIHRRVDNLEKNLLARIEAENKLTDSKFVTQEAMMTGGAERVRLALDASKEAIIKAEVATEKRFEGVNEFRAQLSDQARTFMPRTEAIQLAEQASERIRELSDRLTERIGELTAWRNRTEGQGLGVKENRNGLYAALSATVAVIAIVGFIVSLLRT